MTRGRIPSLLLSLVTVLASGAALIIVISRGETLTSGICGMWAGVSLCALLIDVATWRKGRS